MNVYEARHLGRDYCNDTEGSDHYKEGGVEPIDLMISKNIIEDFCIGNMVKYATRFKITRNLVDLKKVSDYSHILCGVELEKRKQDKPDIFTTNAIDMMGEEDVGEPKEPEEKYEGLSDITLKDLVCFTINGCSEKCPLFLPSGGYENTSCTCFPESRKIMLKYLNGLDDKNANPT